MNTDFAETMKNTNQLIGCCGLDCEKCDARIATITNDNALHGGNFTKVCENADGSLLKPVNGYLPETILYSFPKRTTGAATR